MSAVVTDPTWYERAACRETGVEHYFDEPDPVVARETCLRCPVREACLMFALTNEISDGIWGGLTPTERRRLAARYAA